MCAEFMSLPAGGSMPSSNVPRHGRHAMDPLSPRHALSTLHLHLQLDPKTSCRQGCQGAKELGEKDEEGACQPCQSLLRLLAKRLI